MNCDRCGGEMQPGIPGDVYCPNEDCFKASIQRSLKALRAREDQEERYIFERLTAKYARDE